MENTVTIISRKPPYGSVNAAEAVRHALGAEIDDWKVYLFLVDGGVYLAKKGHDVEGTGYTNLIEGLESLSAVYVDRASLYTRGLTEKDIIDNAKVVETDELIEAIKNSQTTMIF
jgi:sulfur relay (sulfurtransferase) DsrF/TusC family protein